MESLPKLHHSHLSINHTPFQRALTFHPSSLPTPFSSISPIRASFSPSPKPLNPLPHLLKTLTPLVKPTCVAIAATAFFVTRLQSPPLASAEQLLSPPASSASETLSDDPQSVIGDLIKTRKFDEAIRFLDRQIDLDPEDLGYPLLKAHLHMRIGEPELAATTFDYLLKKEPFNVDAYRGLLILTSEKNKSTEELLKRIQEIVGILEEQERYSDVREFKLLIAQVKVIDGDLSGALKVYEELVKTEPEDFRPYFCQGVVYGMLKKKDEAQKQFEKYRALVPEDHPHNLYFEDSSKILEMGGVGAKS